MRPALSIDEKSIFLYTFFAPLKVKIPQEKKLRAGFSPSLRDDAFRAPSCWRNIKTRFAYETRLLDVCRTRAHRHAADFQLV